MYSMKHDHIYLLPTSPSKLTSSFPSIPPPSSYFCRKGKPLSSDRCYSYEHDCEKPTADYGHTLNNESPDQQW